MKSIFQRIAEKQHEYYYTLPGEIREMIQSVEGADFTYEGKKAMVLRIYTDSTADIVVLDNENGNEFKRNVKLVDI